MYAACAALATDSYRLTWDLIEKAGVAITPGIDFGANAHERHVRVAHTTALDRLAEGVERIRRYLGAA